MKHLYAKILPLFIFLLAALPAVSQVSVSSTAGNPGPLTYPSLKAAFAAVNAGTHQGNITITISANTTETGAVLLNASGAGTASYTNLLIKPATSTSPVITMDSAILLNGADNVVIDGSNVVSGTTRNLTISNTSLFGPTIHFTNGASVNNIKNCIIKGVFDGGGVVLMGTSTASTGNNNNIIQNNEITKGATSPLMCISNMGSSGKPNTLNIYSNNRITDFSLYGFSDGNGGAGYSDQTVFASNKICENSPQSGNLTAIMIDNAVGITNMTISGNVIDSLQTTSTTGTIVGIDLYDVVSVSVYNNMIALQGTGVNIRGIAEESNATTNNIYFNTVSIYGTGTGTTSSFAFLKNFSSTNTALRNNIFSNTRLSSGTGGQYAIVQTSTGGAMTCDYNDLISTGNANNILGSRNNSNFTTLNMWRAATGYDLNSVSVAPVFVSPTNLHLVNGSNAGLDNKGISIAQVPVDIDAESRSVTPDIGADEMPASSDVNPPVITYTPLGFTCSTSDRTLSVNMVDASGVDTTGSLKPRIYYKKSTGVTWFSSAGSFSSGSITNGTWIFTIVSADLGTIAPGDVIQYYVIAQDKATPANIGSSPSGAVASNVNTVTTPPATPNSYSISTTLSGTFTVGSGGTYPTLTAAVNAYNTSCLGGPVVFSLISATYTTGETFPLVIQANSFASVTNTLTIKPAVGVSPSVTTDTSVFILNGATYISIDGSNTSGGVTRNLTLSNTRTSGGSTVVFINGASNNTLRNTIVKGVSTSFGVVQMSTSSAATGNNNNLIQNNEITKGVSSPVAGIYNTGTAGKPNTGNIYSANKIYDFSVYGFIDGNGTTGYSTNTLFEKNEIYQTVTQTGSLTGVYLRNPAGINGMVISKNRIYDMTSNSTTGSVMGIQIYDALSVTVVNNMIAIANSTANVRGILQEADAGSVIKILYNTVSLTGAASGTSNSYAFVKDYLSTNDEVKDNIFYNNRQSSGTGYQYAIGLTGSGTMASNYNDLLSTGGSQNVLGISGIINYSVLSAWQTATGLDLNSISIPPVFVSANDLHLIPSSNSGIDNKGLAIGTVTIDIDNDTRHATTPDIGADEMVTCTQPVITTPNTATICSGTATNISLTSSIAGTTYAWTLGTITGGITGASAGSGNLINQILTNPGNAAGTVQYIVTATASGCSSNPYPITVTVNPNPQITSAASASICSGNAQNYTITSNVTGTTFSWNRAAVTGISNATASGTSSVINETLTNTTSAPIVVTYAITASSNGCSSTVFNYQVTVNPKPQASFTTSSPVCTGNPVLFTDNSIGSISGWSWNFGDNTISTIANPSHIYAGPGIYLVKLAVMSALGCASDTMSMAVMVSQQTSITTQPTNQTTCTGSAATFSVTATGSTLTYQWRKNGANIPGATSSSYTIAAAIPSDAGSYDVIVTGSCGTITSNAATLSLNTAPIISIHPQSQAACAGGTLKLYVVASGSGLTYVWRKNGIVIPAANMDTLTLSPVDANTAGSYDVIVSSSCATTSTSNAATITVNNPVVITTDPGPQNVCIGGNISITVAATGTAPISYQWRKNGINIPGAVSSTYTITNATPANAGNYSTIVSNACGQVVTTPDTLIVTNGVTITSQPTNQTACTGSAATFTLTASGSALTYQWRKGGIAITGATSATYTIPATVAGDAGSYDVVVTGSCGSVTSNTVTLTLNAPPSINTQPTNKTVCTGGTTSLTVVASGTGLTYQWRKGGVNISGATAATYTITNASAGNAGSYDVVVSNSCGGSVTSNTVTVTVSNAATITSQPSSQTVCAGAIATFSVTATGAAPVSYQWRKNGSAITGATNATYQIVNTLTSNAGLYDVVITTGCGSVTSSPAVLIVSNCTAVPQLSADVSSAVLMPSVMKQSTQVKLVLKRAMKTEWIVSDALGNVVRRFAKPLSAGENSFRLETSDLASGTYQVTVTSSGTRIVVLRFIKQ
jgi:hypothetical protein